MNNRKVIQGVILGVLALFSWSARAQTAPAGNEHPETTVVSAQEAVNPFGAPQMPRTQSPSDKHAFASKVDLEPLRNLAVFHNGRIKILDTLARESVSTISGRRNYFDVVVDEGSSSKGSVSPDQLLPGKPRKLTYDPLFTLMDLMIDPGYYADKPLIHVEYLPLRRALVERAFPDDEAAQERWMKIQRVTPVIIQRYVGEVMDAHAFEPAYSQGVARIDEALALWGSSPQNLLLITPASVDLPWAHLSSLPEEHPARVSASALGAAWRAGDPALVSAAAADLAKAVQSIHPDQYPTSRTSLESVYNRLNAFEWGMWAYCVSLVGFLLALGTGRQWLMRTSVVVLLAAIALHGVGFSLRCLIAERFAIQNQFESMTGLSLFGAVVGVVLLGIRRQPLFAAAASALGFMVLITATQTGIPGQHIEREAAILNTSILLKYHVTTVLVSYALITLGFVCSLFYLGTHYAARFSSGTVGLSTAAIASGDVPGDTAAPSGRERTLADLDRAQMIVLQLAFWTLGVGILLGAWWADHSWGRWWAFDPKETWALITWIVYLIVIHVRFTSGRNRGLITAWLSVLGFIVMLWTYFGVNLLLPGLHAYA